MAFVFSGLSFILLLAHHLVSLSRSLCIICSLGEKPAPVKNTKEASRDKFQMRF